jgi:hypothetical protein
MIKFSSGIVTPHTCSSESTSTLKMQSSQSQHEPLGLPDSNSGVELASHSRGVTLSNVGTAFSDRNNHSNSLSLPKDNPGVSLPVSRHSKLISATWSPFIALFRHVRTVILYVSGPLRHRFGEKKKVVIDQSWWLILRRCSIHFLPIMATVALTALRFIGFYIGSNFEGSSTVQLDTVDTLALQVTSKLMVRNFLARSSVPCATSSLTL